MDGDEIVKHETTGVHGQIAAATEFQMELRSLLNRISAENMSNTPDFILADYMIECLNAFDKATRRAKDWSYPQRERLFAGRHV